MKILIEEVRQELIDAGLVRMPKGAGDDPPCWLEGETDRSPSPNDLKLPVTIYIRNTDPGPIPYNEEFRDNPFFAIDVRSVSAAEAIVVSRAIYRHLNQLRNQQIGSGLLISNMRRDSGPRPVIVSDKPSVGSLYTTEFEADLYERAYDA